MDDNDSNPDEDEEWIAHWQRIKENDPDAILLELHGDLHGDDLHGDEHYIQNMTDEEWEELGRDISSNTYLKDVILTEGALNDHKISFLFQGLTGSSSIEQISLYRNGLSAAGVRSMMPFLQNANNLMCLDLDVNDLQSEGFNMLLRALQNSPIETLSCEDCGIESIEIDNEQKPKHLKRLYLDGNKINADGCRGLATLLHGGDVTLTDLRLTANKIDDEAVETLIGALQNNTSLNWLNLQSNDGISKQGQSMLLKLVNNFSNIEATLQSNHTLKYLTVDRLVTDIDIQAHIDRATQINREEGNCNPAAAARAKVIKTQLHSGIRAELAGFQGTSHSVYSEINPLHLPEVLALVGKNHDQGELYLALKSSIAGVISTLNRKQCLQQEKAYCSAIIAEYRAKMEAIEAEIAAIEAAEVEVRAVDAGK